jgi:hypothetical protein
MKNPYKNKPIFKLINKEINGILSLDIPVETTSMNFNTFVKLLQEDLKFPVDKRHFDYSIFGTLIKIDNDLKEDTIVCDTYDKFKKKLRDAGGLKK